MIASNDLFFFKEPQSSTKLFSMQFEVLCQVFFSNPLPSETNINECGQTPNKMNNGPAFFQIQSQVQLISLKSFFVVFILFSRLSRSLYCFALESSNNFVLFWFSLLCTQVLVTWFQIAVSNPILSFLELHKISLQQQ